MESKDADGSGTLHVSELVHGLLKIRGDIKSHGCLETSRFWIFFRRFFFWRRVEGVGKWKGDKLCERIEMFLGISSQ